MGNINIIEIIGYVGSTIVLISFFMTSVVKLRLVNSLGSLIFFIYAMIIHSYPTALMNLCLVLINLRFLWKMRSDVKTYDIVKVSKDDEFLKYFIEQHKTDILACFPGLNLELSEVNNAFIIC